MDLTADQIRALENGEPVTVFIGATRCVLLRDDEDVDYGMTTEEEIDLLASHAADLIRDDLDEPI